MKFKDYETEYFSLYGEFCETVRQILTHAVTTARLPRPQSMQCRPKDPKRLKARLEQEGTLESDNIEDVRRDLAGARIIFYTETDVNRFLGSRLIFENFEVEEGGIRIHHPTRENDQNQYRGIHYTVTLKDDRTKLPEYAKFKGLRCEVQVQTVLHHAWSETSHDILYKNEPTAGFGTDARKKIEERFLRIMNKYLLPAGYEFQRVQHDYERLQQGKAWFDRDLLARLDAAADNNESYEILSSLKEDVLPNYDDVYAVYGDVLRSLVAAVKKARTTEVIPIKLALGELQGKTASDVAVLAIEIIEQYRYADPIGSFDALREISSDD